MSQPETQNAINSSQDVSVQEKEPKGPIEYPGLQKRILIMISLYLSIFLVTLVRHVYASAFNLLTMAVGPKHYLDGNPSNHRRVPLSE
jgi:hypothetical protein